MCMLYLLLLQLVYNKLSDEVVQALKVPLSYAPRQKFLARIESIPETDVKKDVQVLLPRMAFEMLSIGYDPNRRVSYIQQNRKISSNRTKADTQYAPSPYNIDDIYNRTWFCWRGYEKKFRTKRKKSNSI